MYYGLVHYPRINHEGFHSFRKKYDPFFDLLPSHVTFMPPVPGHVGRKKLEEHIECVLSAWSPFRVHFCNLEKTWDHWMYLGAEKGHDSVVELHDALFEGLLRPYLREDLPFYPHIGLGVFGNEPYDFKNPTAELTLDEKKYIRARKEFEELGFECWCNVDLLTLVTINSGFTECNNLMDFTL